MKRSSLLLALLLLGRASGDECIETLTGDGADYRGCQDKTRSGQTCLPWTDHGHSVIPAKYPLAGLDGNYCRNPDQDTGIWCYTSDADEWGYCDPIASGPEDQPAPPAPPAAVTVSDDDLWESPHEDDAPSPIDFEDASPVELDTSPEESSSPDASELPEESFEESSSPDGSPSPEESDSEVPSVSPSASDSPSHSPEPSESPEESDSPSESQQPSPSPRASPSPKPSQSQSQTISPRQSPSQSRSQSASASRVAKSKDSATPSGKPSQSQLASPSAKAAIAVPSPNPSNKPSPSPKASANPSTSPNPSPSRSPSPRKSKYSSRDEANPSALTAVDSSGSDSAMYMSVLVVPVIVLGALMTWQIHKKRRQERLNTLSFEHEGHPPTEPPAAPSTKMPSFYDEEIGGPRTNTLADMDPEAETAQGGFQVPIEANINEGNVAGDDALPCP